MAEVSIIIPIYNVADYLAMCLDSVTGQTFDDIEIICINDGSTDDSLEILNHYQKFDSRIKIINKENGGLSSARNAGMKIASGKYIMFVDSDDWISTNAVEILYNNAEKNNSDLVVFDYCYEDIKANQKIIMTIDKFGKKYENKTFNAETIQANAYKYIPIAAWAKLYKTDLIKGKIDFYEDIVFEDVPYWAYIYSHAQRITYISEPFYFYRMNRKGAITLDNGRRFFDIIKAYARVEETLKQSACWEKCAPAMNLIRVIDILKKYDYIATDLKEEFFNKIKTLKINTDNVLYEEDNVAKFERSSIERFKLLEMTDYKTFCELTSGVVHE